jgi:hypothetical protein
MNYLETIYFNISQYSSNNITQNNSLINFTIAIIDFLFQSFNHSLLVIIEQSSQSGSTSKDLLHIGFM